MFTGLDVVVILLVVLGVVYANTPKSEAELKLEPLTVLLIIIVAGAIVVSLI